MTETLTQRRRRLLRDEIATIAIDLFVERGFDDVTVDDIAEAAGTSQRTFFRYFASKDDVVLDLARRLDRRLVEALRSRPESEGAVTALREAYLVTSSAGPGARERAVRLARVLATSPALRVRARGEQVTGSDEITATIAHRMGVRRDDRRARVLVTAMTAVAIAEFHRWAAAGGRGNPGDAIAAALELVERGLSALDALGATGHRP